jgi:hypothetical protein
MISINASNIGPVTAEKSVMPRLGPRFMPSCPLLPTRSGTLAARLTSDKGVARCVMLSVAGPKSSKAEPGFRMPLMVSASAFWTHSNSSSSLVGDDEVQFRADTRVRQAVSPSALGNGLTDA